MTNAVVLEWFYQVVLNGRDADCRFPPLSLVDEIRIQTIRLSQRKSFSILLIIDLLPHTHTQNRLTYTDTSRQLSVSLMLCNRIIIICFYYINNLNPSGTELSH